MVLAGLTCARKRAPEINQELAYIRDGFRMHAELKWSKVHRSKIAEYKAFIDYLFLLIQTDRMRFHALVVDTHLVDHRAFNGGDTEMGFYKFYYQLLLHSFGGKYLRGATEDRCDVFLDRRNTKYKLETLRGCLNGGMRKRYRVSSDPFKTIEPRDSHDVDLLQIVDIVAGAIGYQKNGLHLLPGAKDAKVELARYIAEKAALPNLSDGTPAEKYTFTIWNFRLSKKS
jgi:hypothetical protein